jgi:hypothetical protein
MARKLGQIIARGQTTWLVRIYQGRDTETRTRKYLVMGLRLCYRLHPRRSSPRHKAATSSDDLIMKTG